MKNYTVYFEVFNKKMKTTVLAENEGEAKEQIQNRIIFHKIEETKKDEFNQVMDMFDGIFEKIGTKNPKK